LRIQPDPTAVKRIVLWYNAYTLTGIQLFDKDGNKLLETSEKFFLKCKQTETILEEGERIVGIKARRGRES
jgi:hypothetical protein